MDSFVAKLCVCVDKSKFAQGAKNTDLNCANKVIFPSVQTDVLIAPGATCSLESKPLEAGRADFPDKKYFFQDERPILFWSKQQKSSFARRLEQQPFACFLLQNKGPFFIFPPS